MGQSFSVNAILTSSRVGRPCFQENLDRLRRFPCPPDANTDGLIHLLAEGEYRFDGSLRFTLDAPPCFHLYALSEGTLSLAAGERGIAGEGGQLLFFRADGPLDCQVRGCRYYHALLAGAALPLYARQIPVPMSAAPFHTGASRLPERIRQLLGCGEMDGAETLKASKWLTDIFTELSLCALDGTKKAGQIPDYVQKMKELFDTRYEENFSLEDLERRFNRSRYRLCREFSRCYGAPPLRYLNHLRVERAKELLISTSLPVHEVGAMVGIDNANHFINLFKRETGTTPLMFRQEAPAAISGLHCPCTPYGRPR